MTAAPSIEQKSRFRRMVIMVILVSIGIHLAAGIVAGLVIVARYFAAPPAEFKVTKDIRIPAKQREHKMNMASFDAMAPKPSFSDRMQSTRPTPFALPELPKMPMDQMLPIDPSQIISDQVSSLVGAGGLGNGAGTGGLGGGGTGNGLGMSFLGIQSNGKRILLLFDIATSVITKANKAGISFTKIKEETAALVGKLPISARFGIVQFAQNYKPFRRELLPANDQNRADALRWIEDEWEESGGLPASSKVTSNARGIVGVLELAAALQPDVIFLVSDGDFQWRPSGTIEDVPWKEIEKVAGGPLQAGGGCAIHFIGFEMKPDHKREMGAIVRKSGGKLREIK